MTVQPAGKGTSKMNEGKYNIKAVSALTGIQPGTLRAWERRYEILEPVRNQAGHRLYTDEHIRKLKWLAEKVQQGFTISQAASLLEQQEADPDYLPAPEPSQQDALSEELLQALLHFDEVKAQNMINKAFALFTIDHVTIDILASLLMRIGKLRDNGQIKQAHQQFAASILRARISMAMCTYPPNAQLPKAVAVCGPDEWQELAPLVFTFWLRRLGYEVVYPGAGLKREDIHTILSAVKPEFLFVSCTVRKNFLSTLKFAEELKQSYPNVKIGIGGAALNGSIPDVAKPFVAGAEPEEWKKWMSRP